MLLPQTKQSLSEAGVDVSKLEAASAASGRASATQSVARSSNTLLVKNLPYSADEATLVELFGRYGPIGRLVLPPTKTLALLEFLEPQDARQAFKSLAYKKYQFVPLYLEWAPNNIFSEPTAAGTAVGGGSSRAAAAGAATAKVDKKAAVAEAVAPEAGEDDSAAATTTIYVKNVSFNTTDAAFKKHFDKAVAAVGGHMHSARIARKKGPEKKGPDSKQLLSMGFGFVELDSDDKAKQVIKALQGSALDGHKLVLQLSKGPAAAATATATASAGDKRKKDAGGADGKKGDVSTSSVATSKLVVRNVAFEATRKDIVGLFSPFGHLKSCRLPKKFDGSHRGFAFVEFMTKQEAKAASEGLGKVHLYGRRLVVEYAKEDEGLDELRAKTGSKLRAEEENLLGQPPAAKRMKAL